jgi:hypothetical protein
MYNAVVGRAKQRLSSFCCKNYTDKEKFVLVYAMKAYGGGEVYLHSFLTLALDGSVGQLNVLATLSL